jgi:hypothetical protein
VHITGNRLQATNWGYGAGIYASQSGLVISRSAITQNATEMASWGYGGGVYLSGNAHPVLRNVTIAANAVRSDSWNYGAGLFCGTLFATLVNVKVLNNVSADSATWYHGTGIYLEDGTVSLTNVLVAGNIMGKGGSFYYGAGIYVRTLSAAAVANLTHVTVANNRRFDFGSVNGSGLFVYSGVANAVNSIFWNSNAAQEMTGGGMFAVTYSIVRGGMAGMGNVSQAPVFMSASDFHLNPFSPGIGAGDSTVLLDFDLDNQPRPVPAASHADMGCYETDQTVAVAYAEAETEFMLFPNPATDLAFVKLPPGSSECLLLLTDAAGREVYRAVVAPGTAAVPLRGLTRGLYQVTVLSPGSRPSGRRLAVQ